MCWGEGVIQASQHTQSHPVIRNGQHTTDKEEREVKGNREKVKVKVKGQVALVPSDLGGEFQVGGKPTNRRAWSPHSINYTKQAGYCIRCFTASSSLVYPGLSLNHLVGIPPRTQRDYISQVGQ